jgi:hypothetical protein
MIHPDIYAQLSAFAEAIENGQTNPLNAYIELYQFSELIDEMLDQVKDQALEERRKYGKEEVIKNGFKVELGTGRKLWYYADSKRWNELNDKRKMYEELMQKATMGAQIADAETGELVEPAELKFSKDYIKLTEIK